MGRTAVVLMLFVAATVVFTWPVAREFDSAIPGVGRDSFLNTWALVWEARMLLRLDFANVFNGNIFYPNTGTVLFSENLVGWQPVVLPVWAATRDPVVVYNTAFLLSFVLAGFCTYLLMRGLTGSTAAGVVAGLAVAFGPFRAAHFKHLQILSTHWTPLALLFVHRFFIRRRLGWAVAAGAAVAMQMLTCLYLGVFLAIAVALWGAYFLVVVGRRWLGRAVLGLGLVALVGAAGSGWLLPLYRASEAKHVTISRQYDEMNTYAAAPLDYLTPSGRSLLWSQLGFPERDFEADDRFIGLIVGLLAVVGLGSAVAGRPREGAADRRRVAGACVLLGLAAWVLSLGPMMRLDETRTLGWGPFKVLVDHVPGYAGIRAPGRFSMLVVLSLTILAGYGVAALLKALNRRRAGAIVATGLGLLVAVEVYPAAAMPVVGFPVDADRRALCRWLAALPGRVVIADVPVPRLRVWVHWLRPRYQALAMLHGRPTINGGSRDPLTSIITTDTLARFPDDDAIQVMQGAGVTHVVAHIGPEWAWEVTEADLTDPRLSEVARFGPTIVYALAPLVEAEPIPAPIVATPVPPGTRVFAAVRVPWSRAMSFGLDPGRWRVAWTPLGAASPGRVDAVAPLPRQSGTIHLMAALEVPPEPGTYAVHVTDSGGRFEAEVAVEVGPSAVMSALDPPARAEVAADVPARLRAGDQVYVPVTLRNMGTGTWPCRRERAPGRPDHDVRLGWLLIDDTGRRVTPPQSVMLRADLGPGQSMDLGLALYAPQKPGTYTLFIDPFVPRHAGFRDLGSTPFRQVIAVE